MKYIVGILVFFVVFSCGGEKNYSPGSGEDRGELVGVYKEKFKSEGIPYGMIMVPTGSFVIGSSSYDMVSDAGAKPITVSMSGFFMDEKEISNNKYRQFVYWVRDFNIRQALALKVLEISNGGSRNPNEDSEANSIFSYAFREIDTTIPFNKFMMEKYGVINPSSIGGDINWDIPLIYNVEYYPDIEYTEVLESFNVPISDRIVGLDPIDVNKFVYKFYKKKKDIVSKDSVKFIENSVKVYPDTTVWLRDFSYSYNEPMHNDYFSHMAFIEYPVVGVSWVQSEAFCNWRTKYKNMYNSNNKIPFVRDFRLPSEFEWEYAARGGVEGSIYSWGGPYSVDDRACVLANFKPLRGDYVVDGYLYTSEVGSFKPNPYGLYNMSGNVSEWTYTSYREDIYSFISSLNPNYVNEDINEKVIRGGSWKDVLYFLQVFVRDYEYKDTSRSYIGFRTIQDFQGIEGK